MRLETRVESRTGTPRPSAAFCAHTMDDVVDEIEQAAAGAGYEEPFPTTRMLKKAGAATRIAAKWKLEFRRRSIARSSA